TSALQLVDEKSGRYKVIVIDNKGVQSVLEVQVGISNRVSAEIVSGLEAGERIVDNPPRTDSTLDRRNPFRIF
ncbi:MAG: hypothetical protein ACRESK_08120, partial [Gammaproteobacteria bacterium]